MPNKKNSLFSKNSNFFKNNSVFNPLSNKPFNKPNKRSSATIKETDNEYLVELPAPNMQKEDFQIQLSNDVLTIKGEKKQMSRNNVSFQSIHRSFKVDESIVDKEKIEVTYTDGVLNIVIPKNEDDIQSF